VYGKMFRQMYHGTLATTGPWQALVTFQQFIVLADREGIVDMTPEAISRETTIPLDIIKIGIISLEKPDEDSRTPDEEGRRIVRLSDDRSWGWRVVNYKRYRDLRREEDRRAYHRQYWHRRKLKDSTAAQQTQLSQPIAEADAKAEAERRDVSSSFPSTRKSFSSGHYRSEDGLATGSRKRAQGPTPVASHLAKLGFGEK
jgi:hypothetical protein